jgi:hypothetical protein
MRNVAFHQKAAGRKVEAFMPEDAMSGERVSTWDIVSLDEAVETDDSSRKEVGTHLKYGQPVGLDMRYSNDWPDFESGSSTIFCRIFFAEQFAALRSACQCEDSFVESLSRCVQFDAAGGKSGSAFLKTKDDRFIAKEISRLEMDALTKFAPAYFDYTRKAFQGQVGDQTLVAISADRAATDGPGQDIWLLQDRLQKCYYRSSDADERVGDGKSLLRATVLEGRWRASNSSGLRWWALQDLWFEGVHAE